MNRRFFIAPVVALMVLLLVFFFFVGTAYAHFEHFAHYNNRGDEIGPYYAYEQLEPEYARPNEPTAIMFSVQDPDGRDTYNIQTMVEVYSATTGERLEAWPWTRQEIGDFQVFYSFPEIGNYQIVLSVAKEGGSINANGIDLPRPTLSSTTGCNCDRTIFNVSISNNFGTIWNTTMLLAFSVPISVIGGVLLWNYRSRRRIRRRGSGSYQSSDRTETAKYVVMLAAIAGGIVHLAVYAEHASLRLEYSIFLLVAAVMQIVYGVAYTLLTLAGQGANESAYQHYRKTLAVNLFGLVGTGVLLGLYAYAVTLPPPLSPNNEPEDIDAGGILAKAIEVFTVIGIVYLMRLEKKDLSRHIKKQI
jgi:ABC-type sugar transport system permease subunit